MTKKVISITYTFDKHGNPSNINLNLDGDNLLIKDDCYLKHFIKCVDDQKLSTNDASKQCHGLKLVKV